MFGTGRWGFCSSPYFKAYFVLRPFDVEPSAVLLAELLWLCDELLTDVVVVWLLFLVCDDVDAIPMQDVSRSIEVTMPRAATAMLGFMLIIFFIVF